MQTALHHIDPLLVPDGRWTAMFRRRLRRIRTARGMSDQARVDAALWNHADVQAGFWADPWSDGGPTEADLVERVVGLPTPRPGGADRCDRVAGERRPARRPDQGRGVRAPPRPRHRCRVRRAVLLLTLPLPGRSRHLGAAADDRPECRRRRHCRRRWPLSPPAAVRFRAARLPAGYSVADPVSIRRPSGDIAPTRPAVVSFDLDLSTVPVGTRLLLLALLHAGGATPTLTGPDLRTFVQGSPHVAARSIEVVAV